MDQITVLKWGGVLIVFFIVFRLLNKMGLIGTSPEEKGAKELMNNDVINGSPSTPKTIAESVAKAQKKNATSVTKEDVKKYMPSSSTMLKWLDQLKKAAGVFDDDESAVYNVFRQMKNQVSLYAFSQFFSVYMKKSLIDYLSEFMNDSELSKVNDITKNLPKV